MIKVKILKYVGAYAPGQIVEVDEVVAKSLCSQITINGKTNVRAMLLTDWTEADKKLHQIDEDTTAADLAEMGIKNITKIPQEWDDKNKFTIETKKKGNQKNA